MELYENVLIEMLDDEGETLAILRILWIHPQKHEIVTIDINEKMAFKEFQDLYHLCFHLFQILHLIHLKAGLPL